MAAPMDVDSDFIEDQVLYFINSEFGSDIKQLVKARQILEKAKDTKQSLEQKLSLATCEVPSQIDHAVKEAQGASERLTELASQQETLKDEINEHVRKEESAVRRLVQLSDQVSELQKYVQYLNCISQVEDLSSSLQSSLIVDAVDRALSEFVKLVDLLSSLQSSSCHHLVGFIKETILYWYKILRDNLSNDFENVLSELKWPFIQGYSSVHASTPSSTNVPDTRTRFEALFAQLLKLRLPDGLTCDLTSTHPVLSDIPGWRPILLPLDLLIKPLRRRFRYHFFGQKQTNNLEKPEWYLTQVLNWIRDHAEFLVVTVQPILRREGVNSVDAKMEFSRGLVALVMEKMVTDIPDLLYDDHMFSHFIDEILTFAGELRDTYNYAATEPGPLHVLAHKEEAFDKWISIERKFAVEKMDTMLSSPSAWESQFKDMSDVDETKAPECAESFMTLMMTVTDRYKTLPYATYRLRFLDLQLELLDDFRIRLLQVMKNGPPDVGVLNTQVGGAILNTFQYVVDILQEWAESVFFLQLQYCRGESAVFNQSKEGAANNSVAGREQSTSEYDISETFDESKLDALDGTVFDGTIELFEHIKRETMNRLISDSLREVKARSRPYRKDKWISLPSHKEFISLALSSSACDMFIALKEQLHLAGQALCKTLFTQVWTSLAEELNVFIFTEVILSNHFNEGGAAQIHYDMTRNLFPLFGEYATKPENYFRDVKEACILLTMSSGSALLLKQMLYTCLHEPDHDGRTKKDEAMSALHEAGIFKLTPDNAELVLSLRSNLASGL